MGLFGKSQQQQFNELCASTLVRIHESSANDADKERFAHQFLMQAKAAADDKTCDVMAVTKKAAADAIEMVNYFARLQEERRKGNA